ncbi:hypothetical protein SF83666_b51520 (plasmid) [Sinorhizobium fredii CCBAU 83666]|nr:hypothetical protein SF83666_b51520 [Sinorhizobium fredii CCBAU 83666]
MSAHGAQAYESDVLHDWILRSSIRTVAMAVQGRCALSGVPWNAPGRHGRPERDTRPPLARTPSRLQA